jgi:hypothetical protein
MRLINDRIRCRINKAGKGGSRGRNDRGPGVDVLITVFLRFLPIFGENIGVLLKNQCYDKNFA